MDSTDDNFDIELLAALIDGRLSGAERERALKILATSDEALELFAHSLHEQSAADATVIPIRSARRWARWQVVVPAAAAAALVFAMLPKLTGSSVAGTDYAAQLARDPRFAGSLRDGWDQRGWSENRGAADNRTAPEPRFAFRLGVRTVDLQVALHAGDKALASRLVDDISQTLDGIKFTDVVAAKYNELKSRLASSPTAASIESATDAERDMGKLFESLPFKFGQWVAAADLAAQARDASFFQSKDGTKLVRATMQWSLDADDVRDLQAIDARLAQGSDDRAFDDVHTILQRVIRRRSS